MSHVGARIRDERVRLGLNQDDFSAIAGVQRTAQSRYERGERAPDAVYLAKVAAHGVDVQYVVTGERALTAADIARAFDAMETLDRALFEAGLKLLPKKKRQVAETLYRAPPEQRQGFLTIALQLAA